MNLSGSTDCHSKASDILRDVSIINNTVEQVTRLVRAVIPLGHNIRIEKLKRPIKYPLSSTNHFYPRKRKIIANFNFLQSVPNMKEINHLVSNKIQCPLISDTFEQMIEINQFSRNLVCFTTWKIYA